MKVFKFGGASVKDAAAVRNVGNIIRDYGSAHMIIVISAMGKTTNALEELIALFRANGDWERQLQKITAFHEEILHDLFAQGDDVFVEFRNWIGELRSKLEATGELGYDEMYDQIVPYGELISTSIIGHYLNHADVQVNWLDARKLIVTTDLFRNAKVDWETTEKNFKTVCSEKKRYLIQGFIGAVPDGRSTTLGREGSDFSAAIAAYTLNAESVTIWKDVPGMLNADPKWFDETEMLPNISYQEAVELAYYGATVIHPKTIKPLQNKHIPLFVKSFVDPKAEGTVIDENTTQDSLIPSFIFRMNQILISISPRDFSFIVEENLSHIFQLFVEHNVKINLMQNSAISFSVAVDNDPQKIPEIIKALREHYKVLYNDDLELVTIRHYDDATVARVTENKDILVKQFSRHTARMVMKDI